MQRNTIVPFVAGEDIEAYRLLTMSADNTVVTATDGTAPIIGVSGIEGGIEDEGMDVSIADILPVLCGEDIAVGDVITAGANGVAMVAGAGDNVFGIATTAGKEDARCNVLVSRFVIAEEVVTNPETNPETGGQ